MRSKDEKGSLGRAAMDSLAYDKSVRVFSELSELVLDDEIRDDVFEQLPILRYRGVYKSIKDAFFFNKFCKFLEGINQKPIDERITYIDRLTEDEIVENGKYLVNYIERLDDEAKPEIAGRIFSEYIVGAITKDEMLRFNHILERIFILDLLELKSSAEEAFLETDLALRLVPLGITEYVVNDDPRLHEYLGGNRPVRRPLNPMQPEITTKVSDLGVKFVQTAFELGE